MSQEVIKPAFTEVKKTWFFRDSNTGYNYVEFKNELSAKEYFKMKMAEPGYAGRVILVQHTAITQHSEEQVIL